MRIMMMVMIALILGANFYVFLRLWQMIPAGGIWRGLLLAIAILVVCSFFLNFMLIGRNVPMAVTSCLYSIGTSWIFILLYLLLIFLVVDILRFTGVIPRTIMHGNWIALGALAGFMALVFIGGYLNYNHKRRVELNIDIDKKMENVHDIKIVAVSDLHLGYGIGMAEFGTWIKLINDENPDIVLIAGDLIDTDVRPLIERNIAPMFSGIKSRYGTYLAFGNHEFISGSEKSSEFLKQTGVTVLRDSAVLINESFYVLGRDDRTNSKRKPLEALTAGLDNTKPIIVMDHQPYHLEEAEKAGVDLQFSGHTHRGQVWPISWITDAIYEKSHGYLQKGDSHYYISSGLGIWGGKFRIGSNSEYVVINLQPKEK